MTDERDFRATATIGEERLDDRDIRDAELERARHALAYLKRKLGRDAMRNLLDDDFRATTAQVRAWVEASGGAWQSASIGLAVPGPSAQAFQDWYAAAMENGHEAELRAGHPEHFVSHPTPGLVEVVENVGETELPWRVFYRFLPEGFAFPMAWDPAYALHHGMEIVDADGLRVGFSMRQSRDAGDGLHLQLTTFLPSAAPPAGISLDFASISTWAKIRAVSVANALRTWAAARSWNRSKLPRKVLPSRATLP